MPVETQEDLVAAWFRQLKTWPGLPGPGSMDSLTKCNEHTSEHIVNTITFRRLEQKVKKCNGRNHDHGQHRVGQWYDRVLNNSVSNMML